MSKLTQKAIRESFMKMLNKKPLSKITVKDIVDDCGLNRNTFYYHYQDIPTLLEEIIQIETDRIIGRYPSIDSLEDGLAAATEFAVNNKTAVMHIFHSVNRDIYEASLWKILDSVIGQYYETSVGDKKFDPRDKEIVLNYFKCTCFGLITKWLETGMKDDLRVDFARLCELDKGHIEMLIERCEIS